MTNHGTEKELFDFLDWYSKLNYRYKILIAGNHDFWFTAKLSAIPPIYPDIPKKYKDLGVIYLMDNLVEIEGLRIYGSPWQPEFNSFAFNLRRGSEIGRMWEKIPRGLDILITHGPPYSILDKTDSGIPLGCEELYKRVFQIKPKIHVFGHIHESFGYRYIDGVNFFNVSVKKNYFDTKFSVISLVLDENKEIVEIDIK